MISYEYRSGHAKSTAGLNIAARTLVILPSVAFMGEIPVLSETAKQWLQLSSTYSKASFKTSRSYRSPCCAGVAWQDIARTVTRFSSFGKIIRDVRPSLLGITEKECCNNLDGSSDLVVDVYLMNKRNNSTVEINKSPLDTSVS